MKVMFSTQKKSAGCVANWHLFVYLPLTAGVVKLVDTPDLGSGASRCEGSSPFARTLEDKTLLILNELRGFFIFIPRISPREKLLFSNSRKQRMKTLDVRF